MVSKLKGKFVLMDYSSNMFKKIQRLRQMDTLLKEYTNFFYRVALGINKVMKVLKLLLDILMVSSMLFKIIWGWWEFDIW